MFLARRLGCVVLLLRLEKARDTSLVARFAPWSVRYPLWVHLLAGLAIQVVVGAGMAAAVLAVVPDEATSTAVALSGVVLMVHAVGNGVAASRATHYFPFEDYARLSDLPPARAYGLLVTSRIVHGVCTASALPLALAAVAASAQRGPAAAVLLLLILLACYALVYVLANRAAGAYLYARTYRRIGTWHIGIYLAGLAAFFMFGWALLDLAVVRVLDRVRAWFPDRSSLLDEATWDGFSRDLGTSYLEGARAGLARLDAQVSQVVPDGLPLGWTSLVLAVLVGALCVVPTPRMLSTRPDGEHALRADVYRLWQAGVLAVLTRLPGGDGLALHVGRSLRGKRWIFAPGLLSACVFSYESAFYIGASVPVVGSARDDGTAYMVVLAVVLLVIGNQATEIRAGGFAYFSLAAERDKLAMLLQTRGNRGLQLLLDAKVRVFRIMMLPSAVLVTTASVWVAVALGFSPLRVALLVATVACLAFAFPVYQLYMTPFLARSSEAADSQIGASTAEDVLVSRLQTVPRYVVVVLPTFVVAGCYLAGPAPDGLASALALYVGCAALISLLATARVAARAVRSVSYA